MSRQQSMRKPVKIEDDDDDILNLIEKGGKKPFSNTV
jgi:hypothetical protein